MYLLVLGLAYEFKIKQLLIKKLYYIKIDLKYIKIFTSISQVHESNSGRTKKKKELWTEI